MLNIVSSNALEGINSSAVKVEVDISRGIPSFSVVGLPGAAVRESRERVKSAIINSGYEFPSRRIVVNLSPADTRKEGSLYDLPIALGIMLGAGKFNRELIDKSSFIGELSLDGELRYTNGILTIVSDIDSSDYPEIFFIPEDNYSECRFVDRALIVPVKSLNEVMELLKLSEKSFHKKIAGKTKRLIESYIDTDDERNDIPFDFSDIRGGFMVKRCVEAAVTGRHNMLMIGPPGSGKSMIAKRIPYIIPEMSLNEQIEVSRIYSVTGGLAESNGLLKDRPFRAPHHNITKSAMTGGGATLTPGEISYAHKGVLFLDEVAEFDREILETLRQPLESKSICISRTRSNVEYPADFMLICAMNPCKCGYYLSDKECTCTQSEIYRYLNKLSGPFLDRIDIIVEVSPVKVEELELRNGNEESESIKMMDSIKKSFQYAKNTGKKHPYEGFTQSDIEKYCIMNNEAREGIRGIYKRYNLSTRGYFKLLRLAYTLSIMNESEIITENEIYEAFSMRGALYKYFEGLNRG